MTSRFRQVKIRRREALAGLACLAGGLVRPAAAAKPGICTIAPEADEGPFYFDAKLVRSEIAEGRPGVPLSVALTLMNAAGCTPITGARIDFWHADALGEYSGYTMQSDAQNVSTVGKTFLRGTQMTDAMGQVKFRTIFPGWYLGRSTHLHYRVFLGARIAVTAQIYVPDSLSDAVYKSHKPYSTRKALRDTWNKNDFTFVAEDGAHAIANIKEGEGGYVASLIAGVKGA